MRLVAKPCSNSGKQLQKFAALGMVVWEPFLFNMSMCEIANAKFSGTSLMLALKSWIRYWGTKCHVSVAEFSCCCLPSLGAAAAGGGSCWWPREAGNRKGEVRARLCFCLGQAKPRQCLRFWQLRSAFPTFRFSKVLTALSFVCHLLGCSPVFCRGRKLPRCSV